MKKIKLLILMFLLFTSFACFNDEKSINEDLEEESEKKLGNFKLEKIQDLVETDNEKVLFLFKTDNGLAIKVFLGTDRESLSLVKEESLYKNSEGIEIDGLEKGKEYFYKIRLESDREYIESEIYSFNKKMETKPLRNADWARTSVFYEIFVRSFYDGNGDGTGDFIGLKEKISYLKDLGVDALWLMPSFESPSYHGYDTVDYYSIDSEYGTMDEFKEFLQEAHNNDIKVILDLVINHSSSQHEYFVNAQDEDSEYRDYYIWNDEDTNLNELGDWGQNLWHRTNNGDYFYAVFWSGMPDFNFRNQDLRDESKKIAKYWLDIGVDGFRLDAALHLDEKDEVTHGYWKDFNNYVKSINPDAFLVGENWTDIEEIAPFYENFDSCFNFQLLSDIDGVISDKQDIVNSLNLQHDLYREYSEDFIDATFLTNHDQNRIASQLGGDKRWIKLVASMLLTLPGTPFIYYGEELGQEGQKPDEHIREPFDWYAGRSGEGMTSPVAGFSYTYPNDGISFQEQNGVDGSIYEYYKKLIKIRHENDILFYGDYMSIETPAETYGYEISSDNVNYKLYVVHNLTTTSKNLDIKSNALELMTNTSLENGDSIKLKECGTTILKSELGLNPFN